MGRRVIRSPEALLSTSCLFVGVLKLWISQNDVSKKILIAFLFFTRIVFLRLMFVILIPSLVHGYYRHTFLIFS